MFKRVVISTIILLFVLVVSGCQMDVEYRSSARILRKNEGAQSRAVSPYGHPYLPMVGEMN